MVWSGILGIPTGRHEMVYMSTSPVWKERVGTLLGRVTFEYYVRETSGS